MSVILREQMKISVIAMLISSVAILIGSLLIDTFNDRAIDVLIEAFTFFGLCVFFACCLHIGLCFLAEKLSKV